jgi:hypothetical protein
MAVDEKEIEKIMKEKKCDREVAWKLYQNRKEQKFVEEKHKEAEKPKEVKQETQKKQVQDMIYEKKLEPIIHNRKNRWLIIKTRSFVPITPGKSVKESIENPTEIETKTEFEIKDEGLWQCKKCGAVIKSNPQRPENCTACNRMSQFDAITKPIKDVWILPEWNEKIEVDPYQLYDDMNKLVHDLVVFPDEIYYKIFCLWIISTWKLECWEAVGFPIFRGIISSGKTRALNIIRELGYRCVSASMATFSAIARLSNNWQVTLTIDEANNRLNPKFEKGAELLDFIKQSYKRGSVYVSSDLNDQKEVIVTRNFGFKALGGERSFNPAIISRGIDIFMEKSEPPISKMEYAKDELNRLRSQLLSYRYKTEEPPDLGENYILKGRTREVYESIIRTGMHIGQKIDDIVDFAQAQEKEAEEELKGTVESDILSIIRSYAVNETLDDAPEVIPLSDILERLGWTESRQKQSLGYILKNIGLKTKRTREGRVISLADQGNSRHLKYLYRRYGIVELDIK